MAAEEQTTVGLAETLKIMMEKLDTVSTEVRSISNRLQNVERNLDHLNKTFVHTVGIPYSQNLFQEVAAIHDTVIVTDFYASRFPRNIAIKGIEEQPGENLDAVVRRFLREKLDITSSKVHDMGLYAHRMPKMCPEDLHDPIYVKFTTHDNFKYVKGKAEKREKDLLASNITIDTY